jgi:hypothetical protein
MLDQRPGADRFDIDPLVFVKLGFRHGRHPQITRKA